VDRKVFFDLARAKFFNGSFAQAQVDGFVAILDEWDRRGLTDLRWLAYMLATTYWETNQTMQPVREAYWLSEKWRKANLRYYPFYGRGFVQLTWEENYRKMGQFLGLDLVNNPDLAMDLRAATLILFEGMLRAETGVGDFTHRSLEEFFSDTREDWLNARRIINGTDKAQEIAAAGEAFYAVLLKSKAQ
jgi:putative chitinase